MTRQEKAQRLILALALFIAFVGMLWECPPVTQLPFPKGVSAWIDMAPLTQPIPRNLINALVGVLLTSDIAAASERIAALPDSSLVARRLGPVERHLVGAPAYFAAFGLAQMIYGPWADQAGRKLPWTG